MLSCDVFSRAKFAKDDAYILGWKIPPAVGQGSWSSVEYLARRTQRVKMRINESLNNFFNKKY